MALGLSLSATQSNDATYLTVTDTTGETAATGWGVGGNEDYTDIVSVALSAPGQYLLYLTVTVTDKDGTETSYDAIDLYALAETDGTTVPFAATTDLTWTIDASDLVSGTTAMGTSSDKLTDGIYKLSYSLYSISGAATVDTYDVYHLVDGDSTIDVYDALRELSQQYDNEINDESRTIMEALLKYTYLLSIQKADIDSEQSRIINMLWTLDKINSDSSKYSW